MQEQTIPALQERFTKLERRLHAFQVACLLGVVGLVLAACAMALRGGHARADNSGRVLRVRGLIIEDEQGRERILLGAPIPKVAGRRRQDDAAGLIILGENGADRVAVAAPAPDPQVMGKVIKRISPSAGVVIDDPDGNERSGYGILDNGNVVLGLDYPDREAVSLSVNPQDGFAGLMIRAERGSLTERAEIAVLRDGTSLMKLADTTGMERAMLIVRGKSAARFLGLNPKDATTLDVGLLRLNPFVIKRRVINKAEITSLDDLLDKGRP